MAKKDSHDFNDWDDWDDFEDFEDNGGMGDFKSTTIKGKAREAVSALTGGLISGVKASLFSRQFHQKIVESALPREYSTALDKSLEFKDTISDIYDAARDEVDSSNDKLTKGIKPIVDKYGDKLPKRMSRPLRKWTRNVTSSSDWTAENKDELESVAALNDIFNKREQTKSVKNTSLQSVMQTGLTQQTMTLTGQMVANQQKMISYQEQIDMQWKRKTLELQYKSLFVQRKQLDIAQQSLAFNRVALTTISDNTGLPDAIKLKKSELAGKVIAEKIFGAGVDRFTALPSNILRNVSGNIKSMIKDSGSTFREAVESGFEAIDEIDSNSDQIDELGQAGRLRMGGDMAGGPISSWIAGKLGKKIKKKYGESTSVKHGADMLSGTMTRMPRMFSDMVKEGDTGSSLLDMLIEITGIDTQVTSNNGVVTKNIKNELDTQVYFDLLTKKSITEIIPGYLSRIHQEIRTLRTGDESESRLSYDFDKSMFSTDANVTKSIKARVMGNSQVNTLSRSHEEIIKALKLDELHVDESSAKSKKESILANNELKRIFLKEFTMASINNEDFTLESLLNDDNRKFNDEQKRIFGEHVNEHFGFEYDNSDDNLEDNPLERWKRKLETVAKSTPEHAEAQRVIGEVMNNLQGMLGNPSGDLNKHARLGQLSNAHDLNITSERNGIYRVDNGKYIDELMRMGIDPDVDIEEEKKNGNPATKIYIEEAKRKAKELSDSLIDNSKKQTSNIINRIKGISTDDDSPDAINDNSISTFRNTFTETRLTNLNSKYGSNDVVIDAIQHAREVTGKAEPSSSGLTKLFSKSKEFRELVIKATTKHVDKISNTDNDIPTTLPRLFTPKFIESSDGSPNKPPPISKFSVNNSRSKFTVNSDNISVEKTTTKLKEEILKLTDKLNDTEPEEIKKTNAKLKEEILKLTDRVDIITSVTDKASNVKQVVTDKINNIKSKIFTPKDYDKLESEANKFIEENNIDDSDGSAKDSYVKAYLSRNFDGSKAWHMYQKIKSGKESTASVAKDIISMATSKGVSSNVKGALSILFELTKFTGKAGALLTKPHREVLKLIPWGIKKLMGTLVETVNFNHVKHALWLPGEKEPRLLLSGLTTGRYINGEGNVIEKPKDIIGDIYDVMTTPPTLVMSKSEYKKGLYDSTGKLIYKPPGLLAKVTGFAMSGVKGVAKLTGKAVMGYLKITTKPASWIINAIMREKSIDPKLHAELAQLGLTEQTNLKIDALTEALIDKDKDKFNDTDGDGDRDGSAEDIFQNRADKKAKESTAKEEKKKGFLARLVDKRKKKKEEDDDDDGSGISDMIGKGKVASKLAGLARNPYVMGAMAAIGFGGYEVLTDKAKTANPDDIANQILPESLQDSLLARVGLRISDKIVDGIFLSTIRGAAKGVTKIAEWNGRLSDWKDRKLGKAKDGILRSLSEIPGDMVGMAFGNKGKKWMDKLMGIDNATPLFRFRMAQYGFKYNDKESVQAILKLEDDIVKTMTLATEGKPAKIADAITIEQSAAYFDVSINDKDDLTEWISWFANRFRPVFISVVTIMQRLGYNSKELHKADSIMSKQDKLTLMNKSNFVREENNPYDVNVSPLPTEYSLSYGNSAEVNSVFSNQIKEIKALPDDKAKYKEQQDHASKREDKAKSKALDKHKNTKQDRRFDPYATIDKLNTKDMVKGLKSLTVNDLDKNGKPITPDADGKPKFSGSGAGTDFSTNLKENGILGSIISGIGGLFITKAQASPFIPELGSKGSAALPGGNKLAAATATIVANRADGSTATSVSDKPVVAARHARKNAKPSPNGLATRHIKVALQAAGYVFNAPSSASDYPAQALPDMGFIKVEDIGIYNVGDLLVFSSNKNNPNGHIQIYDGANWISDHVQENINPFKGEKITHTLWRDAEFIKNGTISPSAVKKSSRNKDAVKTAEKIVIDGNKEKSNSSDGAKTKDKTEDKKSTWQSIKDTAKSVVDTVVNSPLVQSAKDTYNTAVNGVSNFISSMTGGQKKWQMCVYLAFKNAGFSEQQSRILTAEIGRENSYNPKFLFAGHADPHSGSNLGMLSWQKGRKPTLIQFLKSAGVLDSSNNMKPGQEALNAQAKFIMWELKNTERAAGSKFLPYPNITYKDGTWIIGKYYIRWRITDPTYSGPGIKNRDSFYNMLLEQLKGVDGDGVSETAKAPTPTTGSSGGAKVDVNMASVNDLLIKKGIGGVNKLATPLSDKDPKAVADKVSTAAAGGGMPQGAAPYIAAKYARKHALGSSIGYCARYVRTALQHAGYKFTPKASAYMYAQGTLSGAGFGQIATSTTIQIGDVIVVNNSAKHKHGHICIWDGSNWISDFVQRKWNPYSTSMSYTLWRDRRYLNGASASTGPSHSDNTSYGTGQGGGVYADGRASTSTYSPVTMKYNDYSGLDDELKNSYKNGTSVDKTKVGGTTEVKSKEDNVTSKPVTTTKPTSTTKNSTSKEIANSVSKAVETKPAVKPTAPSPKVTAQKTAEVKAANDKVTQKLVDTAVNKNLTTKMSEVAAQKSSEQLIESANLLKQSLEVQRKMLDKLTSVDRHLSQIARGEKSSNVVDSSATKTETVKSPQAKPEYRVKRAGRDEPMSMSKMI